MYHSTQVAHDDWHSLWKEAFAWSQALFADWEKRVAEQTVLSDIETSFWSMSSCQLEESCSQIENVCSRTLVCTCRISSRRGCVRPAAMRQRHRNSSTLKLCHGILEPRQLRDTEVERYDEYCLPLLDEHNHRVATRTACNIQHSCCDIVEVHLGA
jgi:hypothetical protein